MRTKHSQQEEPCVAYEPNKVRVVVGLAAVHARLRRLRDRSTPSREEDLSHHRCPIEMFSVEEAIDDVRAKVSLRLVSAHEKV